MVSWLVCCFSFLGGGLGSDLLVGLFFFLVWFAELFLGFNFFFLLCLLCSFFV